MSNIILLDCTLRDGGYVNDWEFGHDNLLQIYERLCDSRVDVIELGFLDGRRPFDRNRSIFPDTASIRRIWERSGKEPPMLTGMIDYGTCGIENLEPAEDSFVDIIRVIFKEHRMKEALDYCAEVKAKGYKVCAQLVSVTTYTEESLLRLIEAVNQVRPFALGMVDTYGLLTPAKLMKIDRILEENLDRDIAIGFHAHNNFELAYANSMTFVDAPHQHDIIVDGTLYGMGKSTGNAPLELLAMYLNENYGKNYDTSTMLESIEESVMDFYVKSPWGYKTYYYLSAKNRCHPNYVGDYQDKENLSMTRLDALLSGISPFENKLLYDRKVSGRVYDAYYKDHCDQSEAIRGLSEELKGEKVLLIGPGKNIRLQADKVRSFIEAEKPKVISVNYIPEDFQVDYVFATKRSRYRQMSDPLHEERNQRVTIIATSNVSVLSGSRSYTVNRSPLLESGAQIKDNSFLMLLQVLRLAGVRKVFCAGFDGYSSNEDNYFNPRMEYSFIKENALFLNSHIRNALMNEYADIEIDCITYSHYAEEKDSHFAAF